MDEDRRSEQKFALPELQQQEPDQGSEPDKTGDRAERDDARRPTIERQQEDRPGHARRGKPADSQFRRRSCARA